MKKVLFLAIIFGIAIIAYLNRAPDKVLEFSAEKYVTLDDNGLIFNTHSPTDTISAFLTEKGLFLSEYDEIFPSLDSQLLPGTSISIRRATKIKIEVDGKIIESHTTAKNISTTLSENGIILGRLDKVSPEALHLPSEKSLIIVTRINIEEKVIPEDIAFKTVENSDSKLGWREKKITQTGEKGIREVKYRITYKNGKEISRVALEKKITKEPRPEIVTQGTHMDLGKAAKGQGTWYAFKGGMFAASTTIPRGGFAKVTNTANGKSVVVEINDYGPQGKGRIIDLDKVAFAKLAPLGAGVIGVKVEQILN